jgi:hypothetical protein
MLNDGRACAAMDALTGLVYQYLSQKFRWLAASYTSSNRGAKVNIENIETGEEEDCLRPGPGSA